jgi:hypothetical protein
VLTLPLAPVLPLRPVAAAFAHLGAALGHVLAVELAEPGLLLVAQDTANGLHRRLVVLPELGHHGLQLLGKLAAHHRAALTALYTGLGAPLGTSLAASLADFSAPLAHLLHPSPALIRGHLLALAARLLHVLAHLRLQRRIARLHLGCDPFDLGDLDIGQAELRSVLEHALGVGLALMALRVGVLLRGEADRKHEEESSGCNGLSDHLIFSTTGRQGADHPPARLRTSIHRRSAICWVRLHRCPDHPTLAAWSIKNC